MDNSLYLGSFEVDWRLYDLGLQYHHRCDYDDESHCTGDFDGAVVPATLYERIRVCRVASFVLQDVVDLGAKLGYSKEQVLKAIQEAGKNDP